MGTEWNRYFRNMNSDKAYQSGKIHDLRSATIAKYYKTKWKLGFCSFQQDLQILKQMFITQ